MDIEADILIFLKDSFFLSDLKKRLFDVFSTTSFLPKSLILKQPCQAAKTANFS